MPRRAVFIDFDGTLGHHGIVPGVHVEAIARAREAGHAVLLCTGRPACLIPGEIAALFDGFVASAGAYVSIGGRVLRDERFDPELAERIRASLEQAGVPFVLEAPEAMYGTESARHYLTRLMETFHVSEHERPPGSVGSGAHDLLDAFEERADLRGLSFAKAVVWGSPEPITAFTDALGDGVIPMSNSINDKGNNTGEIQLAHIDKIHGVRLVAEHLGLDMNATVGCGDGHNDLLMLEGVGDAVVIFGSVAHRELERLPERRPALAVPGPFEGGIALAFETLGLIDSSRTPMSEEIV